MASRALSPALETKNDKKYTKATNPPETIALIKQTAVENPRWGAKKVQGELLKLDIYIHKRIIQRYMRKRVRLCRKFGKMRP